MAGIKGFDFICRYYDVTEGKGALAREGERVVVHYEARWRGVTFMTSRYHLLSVFCSAVIRRHKVVMLRCMQVLVRPATGAAGTRGSPSPS